MYSSQLIFCETTLSPGIETFNTLSCFAFLILGAFIVFKSLNLKSNKYTFIFLGLITIYLGVASMILHITKSQIGLIFDFSSMVLLSLFVLSEFVLKLSRSYKVGLYTFYLFVVGLSLYSKSHTILLAAFILFSLFALIKYVQEYFYKKSKTIKNSVMGIKSSKMLILLGLAIFSTGFVFWLLDVTGVYCSNWLGFLNGHSIWHFLNAIVIYIIFKIFLKTNFKGD